MTTKSKTKKQAANKAAVVSTVVTTQNVVSTALALGGLMPEGIVMKRRLTLPTLVLKKVGETRYLAIADALRASKVPGKQLKTPVTLADGTVQTHEKPATICTVGDIMTGEVFTFMVPAVVASVFHQEGEGDWYVGKVFAIQNLGKREGKRHVDFAVSEVDASALTRKAA